MQSGNINSNRSGGAIITRRSDEVTGRFALKKASEREHVQPTETGGRGGNIPDMSHSNNSVV